MKLILIFAVLLNVVHANQIHNENKPCNDATYLRAALSNLHCGANFFMGTEIWKDIPGYEGLYQVSDLGRVKTLARIIYRKNGKVHQPQPEYVLTPIKTTQSYQTYRLYKNYSYRQWKAHRLVLLAFVGADERPIDHINGNQSDNRLCNLRYCTPRQNTTYCREKINKGRPVGVRWHRGRWNAYIEINGRFTHLGLYSTKEDASEAYQQKVREIENE